MKSPNRITQSQQKAQEVNDVRPNEVHSESSFADTLLHPVRPFGQVSFKTGLNIQSHRPHTLRLQGVMPSKVSDAQTRHNLPFVNPCSHAHWRIG